MNLFPYLLGGGIVYWLLAKKSKACDCAAGAAGSAGSAGVTCLVCQCLMCAGAGQVALTDDSGTHCGDATCIACAGTGQTINPELNQAGRYDAPPPQQVDICGLVADARAGSFDARALLDGLLAQGRIAQADLDACRTQPALSTERSSMFADGGTGFAVLGTNAVLETRTAGAAGLTVLPAVNAVSPVLPGFGEAQSVPMAVNVCGLVKSTAAGDREASGRLRQMVDDGIVRITELDRCKLDLTISDQYRVTMALNP
jgi:hypothetical protein